MADIERRDPHAEGACRGVEALIPDCNDELRISDSECARKMHRVCSSERVLAGKDAGMALDDPGQLDRSCRSPVLIPHGLGLRERGSAEVAVAVSGPKCCTNLRVPKPTRKRGIATVPQIDSEVAAGFFDDELHERARVEIDERHLSRVARSPAVTPVDGP